MPVTINEKSFQKEVLESELPVLVDFWAPWCMPCRMVAPLVDKLADKYQGKVKVCKVNTEENMELAIKEGITSIPTFKIYKNGQLLKEAMGNMPESEFVAFIENTLEL